MLTLYGTFAVGSPGQFAKLCRALGEPGRAERPEYAEPAARQANRDRLNADIEALLRRRKSEELGAAGLPCGPVHPLDGVFAGPQVQALAHV